MDQVNNRLRTLNEQRLACLCGGGKILRDVQNYTMIERKAELLNFENLHYICAISAPSLVLSFDGSLCDNVT